MKFAYGLFCILIFTGAFELEAVEGNIGKQCNATLDAYTVNTFGVNPWPPVRSVNVQMIMSGVMNQAENLKAMGIFVYYNGQYFYQESIPESGSYAAGQTCTINFVAYFPPIIPSGSYQVHFQLQNTNGVYLNCWEIDFNF